MGAFSALLGYLWSVYADSTLTPRDGLTLLIDPGFGLTLVIVGLAWWGIAWTLTKRVMAQPVEDGSIDLAQHLHLTPLRIVAVGLALIAACQQLGLAVLASARISELGPIISVGVLGLSGVTLLLANHGLGQPGLSLLGILGGVLALLWGQGLWIHGSPVCSVGLLKPGCVDLWFSLTLIAAGLACLARYISRDTRWERLYSQPLCWAAAGTYSWALAGAVVLFTRVPIWAPSSLPWLLGALGVALIPVVYRLPQAAVVRGLGSGLLLTSSVLRVLTTPHWSGVDWWFLIGWAFTLWGLGNVALPRYNARWPHWRIAPETWPWFGLGMMGLLLARGLGALPFELGVGPLQIGGYLMASALYLFLMLRNSGWLGMSWLAVLALMGAGVIANLAWARLPTAHFFARVWTR